MLKREKLIPIALVFGVMMLIVAFVLFVYKPCIPCALSDSPYIQQDNGGK